MDPAGDWTGRVTKKWETHRKKMVANTCRSQWGWGGGGEVLNEAFKSACKVNTFHKQHSCCLLFVFSLSHGCTMEFSRSYKTGEGRCHVIRRAHVMCTHAFLSFKRVLRARDVSEWYSACPACRKPWVCSLALKINSCPHH